jgi:hypothetical protein
VADRRELIQRCAEAIREMNARLAAGVPPDAAELERRALLFDDLAECASDPLVAALYRLVAVEARRRASLASTPEGGSRG